MPYRIEFRPSARREFNRLASNIQVRLQPHIDALAENPRPPGCKKMKGKDDLWRIGVGDYRIVYQIHNRVLLVLVVTVGNRSDVYR